MTADLINRIAATIRNVDGDHTLGAAALAEAIVEDLAPDIAALAAQRDLDVEHVMTMVIAYGSECRINNLSEQAMELLGMIREALGG
jgi:hypothetical protein